MMRLLLLTALLSGCTLHYASQYKDAEASESTLLIFTADEQPK